MTKLTTGCPENVIILKWNKIFEDSQQLMTYKALHSLKTNRRKSDHNLQLDLEIVA